MLQVYLAQANHPYDLRGELEIQTGLFQVAGRRGRLRRPTASPNHFADSAGRQNERSNVNIYHWRLGGQAVVKRAQLADLGNQQT